VELAAAAVRRGEIVVFPTETVYAVACDAFSAVAVDRLSDAKERVGGGSLPVMVGSVKAADALAVGLTPESRGLIAGFWPGPLTVRCRQQPSLLWDLGGDDDAVVLRMPLHPIAIDVLQAVGPMVVVAANRVGETAPTDCDAAVDQLGSSVSVYLDGGPCSPSPPSTIVDLTSEPPQVLREGALAPDLLREVMPELALPRDEEGEE
jgi:L-threonylcarbamoyladenylate synthase